MKYYYFHSGVLILSILFITTIEAQVHKTTISPSAVVSTNMDELSKVDRSSRFVYPEFEGKVGPNIFPIQPLRKTSLGGKDVVSNVLGIISPAPTATFKAQSDVATFPQGLPWIPPDTWGAVGPTNLMSTHNNNIKIQDKTGLQLSLVSLATFWSPLPGITSTYDPKIVYDPYNNRWIMVTLSDPDSISSSILVAISNTNDPTGAWTEYKYVMGANILGNNCWADYPCIGFNKNWVAISVNMFTIAGGVFQESRVLVINYPELLAGTLPFPTNSLFSGIGDFTIQPCITYSATEEILYAPNSTWGAAGYRLNKITGTSNSPMYDTGTTKLHSVLSSWVGSLGQILPQPPEPETGTFENIDADDDRINNAVFRNKYIYYAQTVGLPAQGMTHTAAQWVVLDTAGTYIQGGRVEEPAATNINGLPWYAYPSINVNGYGDILLGFTQFCSFVVASLNYAASGYCLKDRTDAPSTMRDPRHFKAGESFYWKTQSGSRNRWGDYSFVQPDPSDDYYFWTIQEYADTKVGVGNGSGRWGTQWAKVQPDSPLPVDITSFISIVSGRQVTLNWKTATEINNIGFNVERSVNKTDWTKITFIKGNENSTSTIVYSYIDKSVSKSGKYYYRLKQLDNNGSFKYSNIVEADINSPSVFALNQNFPNPFNPSTSISYSIPERSVVTLRVYDIIGRELLTLLNGEVEAGNYEINFNASKLFSGVYFYTLRSNTFASTKKMLLIK